MSYMLIVPIMLHTQIISQFFFTKFEVTGMISIISYRNIISITLLYIIVTYHLSYCEISTLIEIVQAIHRICMVYENL